MASYTATWQDKETVIIQNGGNAIGKIAFDQPKVVLYGDATLYADGEMHRAEQINAKDIAIKNGDDGIFTSKLNSLWGNFEVQANGHDTGYDIKGKWFKPGTRFTDSEDNDLVVVKTDPWRGKETTIEIADIDISDLRVLATLYHHIRASAAATTAAIIGTLQ